MNSITLKATELLDEELEQVNGAWGGFGGGCCNTIVVSIVIVNNSCGCGFPCCC